MVQAHVEMHVGSARQDCPVDARTIVVLVEAHSASTPHFDEGRIDTPITRSERNTPRFAGTQGHSHCNVKKHISLWWGQDWRPHHKVREKRTTLCRAQGGVPIAMSKRSAILSYWRQDWRPHHKVREKRTTLCWHRWASPLQCQKEAHFTLLMAGLTPPSQGQRETHHALLSTGGRPHCNVKKEHIPPWWRQGWRPLRCQKTIPAGSASARTLPPNPSLRFWMDCLFIVCSINVMSAWSTACDTAPFYVAKCTLEPSPRTQACVFKWIVCVKCAA